MKFLKSLKKYIAALIKSHSARLNLTLVAGSLINFLYIAGNIASTFMYNSVWSAAVSLYHLMLITIRLYLFIEGRRDSVALDKLLFRVGIMLLFLDLACAVIMVYTVGREKYASYSGFIFLAFLSFAVYSIASSILSMKRHSGENKQLHFAAKSLSLSTSLMSVFNLQYSILLLLGAGSHLRKVTILVGGFAVFSVILSLSFGLIRRSYRL